MMRRYVRPLWSTGVIALVGVVACSHDLKDACTDYVNAFNAVDERCGTSGLSSLVAMNLVALCVGDGSAPGTSNALGQFDACKDEIDSLGCLSSFTCVVRGTRPTGAACGAFTQCASGFCGGPATAVPDSEVTCGVCADYVAAGGDCTSGTCDPTTSACVSGTCVPYASRGESCASATCASPFYCDATSTCEPLPEKGQACTGPCDAKERCVSGTCVDPVGEGAPCPTGNECSNDFECDVTSHTCVVPAYAGEGQPCGAVDGTDFIGCSGDLTCVFSGQTGTCIALKEVGDACTVGKNECDTFLACIGGTCQVPDFGVCQ